MQIGSCRHAGAGAQGNQIAAPDLQQQSHLRRQVYCGREGSPLFFSFPFSLYLLELIFVSFLTVVFSSSFSWAWFVTQPAPIDEVKVERTQDDVEIVGEDEDALEVLASYYADGQAAPDNPPVFNQDLGLAIEQLKPGITLQQLWNVTST